jgi:SAM-dependent methyltransferase
VGTAQVQGELWGAKAADWAELQEPAWRPVYDAVLARAGVAGGTKLLDVGCGAGGALVAARSLGAEVWGLDAAQNLVEVARKRLPGARVEVGEMEELPFGDAEFDVVTGFNSFQFAGDVERALREARRVCKPQGTVAMLVWGRKEECDLCGATLPAVLALLPPPPSGSPSLKPLSEPGVIEAMMHGSGLRPTARGELDSEFAYADVATACRAISSAGMLVRAVRVAGEEPVCKAIIGTLAPFTRADGSVCQRNRFQWVTATPAGGE